MTTARFSVAGAKPIRVDVMEPGGRTRRGAVRCTIGEHIRFSTEGLQTYFFATWDAAAVDLLLVAAAVEFCDKWKTRPAQGWSRSFDLRVPVHDVDRWRDPIVYDSLVAALCFLTGDGWQIEFVPRKKAEQPVLQAPLGLPSQARSIIPYSGGLDSRAVAGLVGAGRNDALVRVRLGSSGPEQQRQRRARQPFTAVPYRVSLRERRQQESSARSRGFKFAAVTGVAAHLADALDIVVPESGQGALGPSLVVSGQSYADYRNHPAFTVRMESLLNALFGRPLTYRFPRIWSTKGETLAAFARLGRVSDGWQQSRSCWQQSRQASVDGELRQCGICAACMLRRLSVHAAGLDEPQTGYVWENLRAPTWEEGAAAGFTRMTGAMRDYAIAGVLHLDHLAALADSPRDAPMVRRVSREVANALRQDADEAKLELSSLLRRHRAEWLAFLDWLGPASFVTKLASVRP